MNNSTGIQLLQSVFIFALAAGSTTTIAATVNTNKCDEEWKQVLDDKRFSDIQRKIKRWESLAPTCGRSGLYESRLGALYTRGKMFEKAQTIIEQGLAQKTSYEKELLSGLADIDLIKQDWGRAGQAYELIIKKFPDWYDGYQGLGSVKLSQQNFIEAVKYLNEANKYQHHVTTYRQLTIAHHQLNQHEQAIKALNAAFELDQELIVKDRDAMLSGAISYTKIGKYKVASGIIGMLLEARPDLRGDAEIARIQSFVDKKLKEAQSTTG